TRVQSPDVPSEECDPLEIRGVIDGLQHLPRGKAVATSPAFDLWTATPDWFTHYEHTGSAKAETDTGIPGNRVELFGSETTVYRVPSVSINQELRISGGDVTLLVDGDFTTGGDPRLTIDPGSTLTLLVRGKVSLGTSLKMNVPEPVNSAGLPSFMIFSDNRTTGKIGRAHV